MFKAQCHAGKVNHARFDKEATLKELTGPWRLGLVLATKSAVAGRRKNAVEVCSSGYIGNSHVSLSLRLAVASLAPAPAPAPAPPPPSVSLPLHPFASVPAAAAAHR